ncbi:serine acetyltransferase [Arthrobacter sp. PvP102]|uniref:hypothetical protein n=1 Tax=unclassified Arthrobacter TaxID=235627 RepID=UPI001AE54D09|nr:MULTISPECIES: hypothetical protein [unclassified Arthrobacter]MBP1232520.1 serine acetyltransferase [Arthrobacter sp. PvP103]MBP1237655.1 serine acetyltransferase [Arthrobacter sp. PvP102]
MNPATLWKLSSRAYYRGRIFRAKVLKLANYLIFRCILPYECELSGHITLWHRGLGTVVHPSIRIGHRVQIAHGVTIAGSGQGKSVIGDDVIIAAGAIIIPKAGKPYEIGNGAVIGAGAVVVGDVLPNSVMVGNPARNMRKGALFTE